MIRLDASRVGMVVEPARQLAQVAEEFWIDPN
jgi:hypothetical protein